MRYRVSLVRPKDPAWLPTSVHDIPDEYDVVAHLSCFSRGGARGAVKDLNRPAVLSSWAICYPCSD